MARILTGVKPTGTPHLGNLLGAIYPAIELANVPENDSFLFIADLHSLTTVRDSEELKMNSYETAAIWLASGYDADKGVFFRQSDVPETTELAWYLSCFMPYNRLKLAHAFKDKADQMDQVNTGIFTYPILMAADILLYDADIVPVGKDQKQHLEFTRDMAQAVNRTYGDDTLIVPEARIDQELMTIPGTDGQKMSKSKNNIIFMFEDKKKLKKQVMSIITSSTPLEEPKDPDSCNVFALYKLLADEEQVITMRNNYLGGNYGYGHAKKELLELIWVKFEKERETYKNYMDNLDELDRLLSEGANKARSVASKVLGRIREKLGYTKYVNNSVLINK